MLGVPSPFTNAVVRVRDTHWRVCVVTGLDKHVSIPGDPAFGALVMTCTPAGGAIEHAPHVHFIVFHASDVVSRES